METAMESAWNRLTEHCRPGVRDQVARTAARDVKGVTVNVSVEAQTRAPHRTTPALLAEGRARIPHRPVTAPVRSSVGIMAYNEEANIGPAVDSILSQALRTGTIEELIVVASGCEDRTAEIVTEVSRTEPRVRLIEQSCREGKASAINLFIAAARSPVLTMASADVLLKQGALEAILRHFADPTVGMVGGHPIPVNDESTLLGHAVHLQWRLHDQIARQSPKLGEMVAFRNVVPSIPLDTAVDEISIQAIVTQLGYRLVYEPDAIVFNRGPSTVRDFIRQRRRIYAGHLRVAEQQQYAAPTMDQGRVWRALRSSGAFSSPRAALRSTATVGLEAAARMLGHYDVSRGRSPYVWEISATTKRFIAEGATDQGQHNALVFHIAGYHGLQLELGVHACRQLTRRVTERITHGLGPQATVAAQQNGTIVALLPGDRESAQRAAHHVVRELEESPTTRSRHAAGASFTVTCGIIAFPQTGPPLAQSITVPMLEAGPATSPAT
jgi:biofilm PGA synthesis N-glycosyltransferase PgaC